LPLEFGTFLKAFIVTNFQQNQLVKNMLVIVNSFIFKRLVICSKSKTLTKEWSTTIWLLHINTTMISRRTPSVDSTCSWRELEKTLKPKSKLYSIIYYACHNYLIFVVNITKLSYYHWLGWCILWEVLTPKYQRLSLIQNYFS